jgi:hypothetical protein
MTVFHIFYIPTFFLIGIAIGVVVGKKGAHREIAHEERARREREERRVARADGRTGEA